MTDNKKDMRDTYTIYDDQTIGKVQIADEVVAIIAGLAATEVEGVASMAGRKSGSDHRRGKGIGFYGRKYYQRTGWKTGYEKPVQRCESRCSGECGMRESEPESGIWIQYSGNL